MCVRRKGRGAGGRWHAKRVSQGGRRRSRGETAARRGCTARARAAPRAPARHGSARRAASSARRRRARPPGRRRGRRRRARGRQSRATKGTNGTASYLEYGARSLRDHKGSERVTTKVLCPSSCEGVCGKILCCTRCKKERKKTDVPGVEFSLSTMRISRTSRKRAFARAVQMPSLYATALNALHVRAVEMTAQAEVNCASTCCKRSGARSVSMAAE